MRRNLNVVLVGLGAFLIVSALLMRFYAYPKLAIAPIDQDSVTMLEATDATILDTDTLEPITSDLSVAATTRGDVAASEKAGGNTRVWAGTTTIRSSDGKIRSQSTERAAFDGVSGVAIDCCDNFDETTEGEREPVVREGLVYKFPFNTQKKDYQFWDSSVGEAATAKYVGTGTVKGLSVLKFTMEIPDTVVGTREVPSKLFEIFPDEAIDAEEHYKASKEFDVEAATGAIVNRVENQDGFLSVDGTDVITTQAVLRYTDAQVEDLVDQVSTQGMLLNGLRGLFPIIAGLLGLILIGVGVVLARRNSAEA